MTAASAIRNVECVVRSYGREMFTTEEIKATMTSLPSRQRVNGVTINRIIRNRRLAEPVDVVCVKDGPHRMTVLWRPLI